MDKILPRTPQQKQRRQWLLVALVVLGCVLVVLLKPEWLRGLWQAYSVDSIAQVGAYLRSFGVWTPLASLALMVLQSVIAPLPGSLIASANGVVFGIWWGTLLSWTGGMLGGAINFGLARWLGRGVVARLIGQQRLDRADALSNRDGFWLILVARLTPLVSFDFISYLAGLSAIGFGRFLLATAIGMLPGTAAWTILGHDLAQAQTSTWRISLIGLFFVGAILGGRWWLRRNRARLGLE